MHRLSVRWRRQRGQKYVDTGRCFSVPDDGQSRLPFPQAGCCAECASHRTLASAATFVVLSCRTGFPASFPVGLGRACSSRRTGRGEVCAEKPQ